MWEKLGSDQSAILGRPVLETGLQDPRRRVGCCKLWHMPFDLWL